MPLNECGYAAPTGLVIVGRLFYKDFAPNGAFRMNPDQQAKPRGVLAKFAAHVTSASEGAVTDKDLEL